MKFADHLLLHLFFLYKRLQSQRRKLNSISLLSGKNLGAIGIIDFQQKQGIFFYKGQSKPLPVKDGYLYSWFLLVFLAPFLF